MHRSIYIETYGCQMNFADTEIVNGILREQGYELSTELESADAIFMNTCAIRDNAEQRIYGRLSNFEHLKKKNPHLVIGILGCMAERLRSDLLDSNASVDIVCGPDEYRRLPALIDAAFEGEKGIRTQLSRVETYDDIVPLRTEGISAWVAVMRGCDKFCTFCVVPFTRGRERSRSLDGVVGEVRDLVGRGFREVTLLGQNVNSYIDEGRDFADLLIAVSEIDPALRVRFTTSHPQDMSDRLIAAIAEHDNICNYIHLPFQSGSDPVLEAMNRTYTREHYLGLVRKIRAAIPDVALSTDVIAGFPGETEEDHQLTLSLMEEVRFDGAFMFKYSPREKTRAWKMGDTVPDDVKGRRLEEIIDLQRRISYEINREQIGSVEEIMLEGPSKRSVEEWMGRTGTNKTVIVPRGDYRAGDTLQVRIKSATSATLFAEAVARQQVEAA
ncbi:tRNA (N6-isopentenyl adenosine(37)-C2)-methylthiotransferase MiaB [bacterium]|nr:tRNA (N6-isopentenyl adenosine(37)-C2)-methylthiotransferase MiaB [bacterium]